MRMAAKKPKAPAKKMTPKKPKAPYFPTSSIAGKSAKRSAKPC